VNFKHGFVPSHTATEVSKLMEDLDQDDARAQRSMPQGPFSVTNKQADFSIGMKIASLCTVSLTVGLLVPLAFARRRSRNLVTDVTPIIPTAHSSPAALLRAQNPSIRLSEPQLYDPSPSSSNTTEATRKASPSAFKDAVKALLIATGLVGTVASASYYGIRQATGIKTVEEFSQFMRLNVLDAVPSSYQARLASSADDKHIPRSYEPTRPSGDPRIDAVEGRLLEAYREGGLTQWGEQAWKELEREWEESDRSKRWHSA